MPVEFTASFYKRSLWVQLNSIFYFLIFPILWREKTPHIIFIYVCTHKSGKQECEGDRKREKMYWSHVFRNLLERDGGTRMNILVKPPNGAAHQKFSKAFHFPWYAFCTQSYRRCSSNCRTTSLGSISELVCTQADCLILIQYLGCPV